MKEIGPTGFQSELVKSANRSGGVGVKLNPMWTKGLSDLFLAHRSDAGVVGYKAFVECKVVDKEIRVEDGNVLNSDPSIKVALTELQRVRLTDLQRVGVTAGWCVAYQMNGEWYAVIGIDPKAERVVPTQSPNIIMRKKGGEWDTNYLVRRLQLLFENRAVSNENWPRKG